MTINNGSSSSSNSSNSRDSYAYMIITICKIFSNLKSIPLCECITHLHLHRDNYNVHKWKRGKEVQSAYNTENNYLIHKYIINYIKSTYI